LPLLAGLLLPQLAKNMVNINEDETATRRTMLRVMKREPPAV
jgi:hypothetical protein